MKKIVLSAVCLVAVAAASFGGYVHYPQLQVDPQIIENMEALSSGESSGGRCTGPKKYGECESRNTRPCSDTSGCKS